jgi:hypothetical protein
MISQIEYSQLRQFEDQIGGNVKVGGYIMDEICPIEHGKCYQIRLQADDISRIFLNHQTTCKNRYSNSTLLYKRHKNVWIII